MIYPLNFVAVTALIVVQQVYDIWLACNDYQVNWKTMPFMSANKLLYNKELFLKQSKCLFIANCVFGGISASTVIVGYLIISHQQNDG